MVPPLMIYASKEMLVMREGSTVKHVNVCEGDLSCSRCGMGTTTHLEHDRSTCISQFHSQIYSSIELSHNAFHRKM